MKCNDPDCIGETFGRDCECYRKVEDIGDHLAISCNCGSVRFILLRSEKVECAKCGAPMKDTFWYCKNSKTSPHEPPASECKESMKNTLERL